MKDMLALRANAGSTMAALERIPRPEVGPRDVLIKVRSAGLAPGVFTMLKMGLLRQLPTTIGHECAGEVEEVGADVQAFQPGDRVRMHPTMSCGRCRFCLTGLDQMCAKAAMVGFVSFGAEPVPEFRDYHPGALAEYVRVPMDYVDMLPDNVSFDVGAKVHDLANAIRCLKAAELPPASTLMILAATGTMGTAAIKLASLFGVARLVLVGRSTDRVEMLRGLTTLPVDVIAADAFADSPDPAAALRARVAELLPKSADAILDFAPNGSNFWTAVESLGTNGTFVHMGGSTQPFPFPLTAMLRHCWRVIATRNHSRDDARMALELLASGQLQVDELISHQFALRDIDKAITAMTSREQPMWWAVIHP
ncbi:alcohol dehydrogenase catalytic domain-containing protein [Agrobacterium rhizogenes]|nr:alcohol dehydrogenase catalytic domain-containing protein [Rhizobium rhizogenes]